MGNHSQLVLCLLAAGMGPVTGVPHPIVLFTNTSVPQSNRFALHGRVGTDLQVPSQILKKGTQKGQC